MLRLLRPTLITLTLAVPTASYALGLGDIHIESALHQPLIAQIELVGVAEEELGHLSASLASDELFQKYNLERAPFIYGTRLTVGRDAQGRPVLNMRSTEKFTEPVVTLLVDLHTSRGELVREYTLFLDPAGLVANTDAVSSPAAVGQHGGEAATSTAADQHEGLATAASATDEAASATVAADSASAAAPAHGASERASATGKAGATHNKLLGQTYKVARRDTLAHIATAAGARSRTEQHRLMIAIYRANPAAFQNNFSRMHTGVTLTLPTAEQLAALSVDDANREYDRQMAEWRASLHHAATSTGGAANTHNASGPATSVTPTSATPTSAMPTSTAPVPSSATAATRGAAGPGVSSTTKSGAGSVAAKPSGASIAVTASPASLAARTSAASLAAASRDLGEPPATDHTVLVQRIATLEQSLAQIQQELKRPVPTQTAATLTKVTIGTQTATTAAATANTASDDARMASDEDTGENDVGDAPRPKHHGLELIAAAVGASLLFFAGAWIYLRRRNAYAYTVTPRYPVAPTAEEVASTAEVAPTKANSEFRSASEIIVEEEPSNPLEFPQPAPAALPEAAADNDVPATTVNKAREPQQKVALPNAKNESSWFEDSFSTPIADLLSDPTVSLGVEDTAKLPFETHEPTATLPKAAEETTHTEVLAAPGLEFAGDTVEQKFSFFNPEATTNTEHVVMDSGLNEPKAFVERRKNPADVLRQAIEREPDRSDLRLKLLELYYTAAAENRRAFLDATRQLARDDKLATPEDWNRIADMGRIIAPDDELFAPDVDDKRVA